MNPIKALVGASLALNLGLATWIALRPPGAFQGGSTGSSGQLRAPETFSGSADRDRAIEAGDVSAIVAFGLDRTTARDIAAGAAYSRYREKLRAIRPATNPDPRYWRTASIPGVSPLDPAQRDAQVAAEREFADALKAIYGEDVSLQGTPDLRLSFLPQWKQETLRRLEQDYLDFERDALLAGRTITLASDSEKLAAIRRQKERELSSLLTPEEREQYELRASPQAMAEMNSSGKAFETEEDYKTYLGAMIARAGRQLAIAPGPNFAASSNADTLRTYEEIFEKLGPEKYAALQDYRDNDRLQLESLRARLELPTGTTERVLALRQTYSLESKRIANDPALPPAQRSQAVRDLGARARADLIGILGDEAGRAYSIRQQNWPELLSRGVAFTTDRSEMYFGKTSLQATYPFSARPPTPTGP